MLALDPKSYTRKKQAYLWEGIIYYTTQWVSNMSVLLHLLLLLRYRAFHVFKVMNVRCELLFIAYTLPQDEFGPFRSIT